MNTVCVLRLCKLLTDCTIPSMTCIFNVIRDILKYIYSKLMQTYHTKAPWLICDHNLLHIHSSVRWKNYNIANDILDPVLYYLKNNFYYCMENLSGA